MQKPPLSLRDHIFTKIHIVALTDEIKEKISSGLEFDYDYNFNIGVLKNPDDNSLYQVQLTIEAKEKEGFIRGYDIDVTIAGIFSTDKKYDDEDQKYKMLEVLGPTLLYGCAREFIYNLTSRGPYPGVYLPTVSFIPDSEEKSIANKHRKEPVDEPTTKKKRKTNK